ncbi:MAG: cytochrome b/b6 domain-containing protein [Rudaea sp.]|uniref:cytochrome b/b6 domain-containing protein n=1 Tax=unclassified Rudaea TaxID=2627037 RepID=UPI0010F7AB02|nr:MULTISPECIES: cytochrome b/b6 domain-containing protein [unclassified Rudaea]MBN8884286.1 cytochrome b/b6 domain-containing protein [Rudaea sp.]MBR0345301.1 cytochrome b/b6 domain-containing protein [Rudaea sp.]
MTTEKRSMRVWDLPTRLFHWALVVLIALQFATAEFGFLTMEWHYRFGYATLALIVFRVLWGFAGSQTSRFGEFVRGPAAVVRYLKASVSANPPAQVGHNPLGGWSVVVMLLCVLVQAVSGLFASDGIDEDGPFVGAVSNATVKLATRLHHLGETALLVLITLHVAAVLLHWALKRDNLIVPMITGRKRADGPVPLRFVSGWLALALFVIVAAAIVMLSRAGN